MSDLLQMRILYLKTSRVPQLTCIWSGASGLGKLTIENLLNAPPISACSISSWESKLTNLGNKMSNSIYNNGIGFPQSSPTKSARN